MGEDFRGRGRKYYLSGGRCTSREGQHVWFRELHIWRGGSKVLFTLNALTLQTVVKWQLTVVLPWRLWSVPTARNCSLITFYQLPDYFFITFVITWDTRSVPWYFIATDNLFQQLGWPLKCFCSKIRNMRSVYKPVLCDANLWSLLLWLGSTRAKLRRTFLFRSPEIVAAFYSESVNTGNTGNIHSQYVSVLEKLLSHKMKVLIQSKQLNYPHNQCFSLVNNLRKSYSCQSRCSDDYSSKYNSNFSWLCKLTWKWYQMLIQSNQPIAYLYCIQNPKEFY